MELYRRKLVLLTGLTAVYLAVSFWVPYSKLWFIRDIMQNQARLFFATQSLSDIRKHIIDKSETLNVRLNPEDVTMQNINGEVIYIELNYNIPLDIFFYHTTLHFEPKIFGLIRGFDSQHANYAGTLNPDEALAELSDSTRQFLREKTLQTYLRNFFAR